MAPLPKPLGRTHRSRPRSVVLLPPRSSSEVPELRGDYLPETREWWRSVWTGPIAPLLLENDVGALGRLAGLLDRVARGGRVPATTLGEIRALEDRFGLSPLARRRLQWQVAPMTLASAPSVDADDRWLRAVDEPPA